jgi:hypothetical protein
MEGKFNQDDKEKLIKFLNFIAKKSQFNVNTQEIIEYFKLLTHMQQVILPKVDKNILEIVEIIEEEENDVSND